ncbi:ring canal kelch protein-like [Drosophila tropicalis]|uniref:ring canal kelch protein-like n=1 Tax=Drosophila tropicalis TaxID=46794 RepID=UPI0035ABA98A
MGAAVAKKTTAQRSNASGDGALNRISKSSLQWLLVNNKWLPLWMGQGPECKVIDFNFMFSRDCVSCDTASVASQMSNPYGTPRLGVGLPQDMMQHQQQQQHQRPLLQRARSESPTFSNQQRRLQRQAAAAAAATTQTQNQTQSNSFKNYNLNVENNSFKPKQQQQQQQASPPAPVDLSDDFEGAVGGAAAPVDNLPNDAESAEAAVTLSDNETETNNSQNTEQNE